MADLKFYFCRTRTLLYWKRKMNFTVFCFLLSPCIPSTFAYPILRLPLVLLTPMSYCWLSIYRTTLYFTTVFHFFELFAFRILFDFSVPLVRMFEFHQGTSFYWWPSTTFLYHYCTTSLFTGDTGSSVCFALSSDFTCAAHLVRHFVRCSWEPPFRRSCSKLFARIHLHILLRRTGICLLRCYYGTTLY